MARSPSPPFPVAKRSCDAEPRSERHGFLRVVLPLAGTMQISVGGEQGRVTGLRCAVVPPCRDRVSAARGRNRFLVADFRGLLAVTADLADGGPFGSLDARGAALLPLLRVEAGSGALAEPVVAEGLGRKARADYGLDATSGACSPPAVTSGNDIATPVRAFPGTGWDQPVSRAEAAAAACCSPSHTTRRFRTAYGIGPVTYLQRLTVARARDLLETTNLTDGEAAARVGFVLQPWFTRPFIREVGTPPAAYRSAFRRESGNDRC